jgi:peptidoglycan/LPS O-acetylase OafA/YrhL
MNGPLAVFNNQDKNSSRSDAVVATGSGSPRLTALDQLRGLLLILVIVSHLLPNNPELFSSPVGHEVGILHYLAVSFRMPLFLAISGFLMTRQRFESTTFLSLLSLYWNRILVPWVLAFVVFTTWQMYADPALRPTSADDVVKAILFPWHHLWYIPSFVIMLLTTFWFERLRLKPFLILSCAGVFTFIWMTLVERPFIDGREILPYLGEKRTYIYFVFFYAGYFLRNETMRVHLSTPTLALSIVILASIEVLSITSPLPAPVWAVVWLFLNLFIIGLTLTKIHTLPLKENAYLMHMGRNSLPIYLWHMVPISLALQIFDPVKQPIGYFLLGGIGAMLVIAAMRPLQKFPIAQRFLFVRNSTTMRNPAAARSELVGSQTFSASPEASDSVPTELKPTNAPHMHSEQDSVNREASHEAPVLVRS